MDIRITILCDNTVNASLPVIGEHGFAAFIETECGNYLFDTGQGFALTHNAQCLKKNLVSLKGIFLSHGHYDHTGGLKNILNVSKGVNIFGHPDIFSKKYALLNTNGKKRQKYIGIKFEQFYYEKSGAEFHFNTSFCELAKGIYLTGEVPKITDFEEEDPRLVVNDNGKLLPDPLLDDQSLVLRTKKGLVVILGCAHSGLINTIEYVLNHLKGERLHALLGGTHLGFLKDVQIDQTIKYLKKYDVSMIGASQCTGLKASARLFQEIKDKFLFANVGASFLFNEEDYS